MGDEAFRDQLLKLVDARHSNSKKYKNLSTDTIRSHNQVEAEKIVQQGIELFELDLGKQKTPLRKSDPRKIAIAIAIVVKASTTAGNQWIAERLEMGHERAASRLVRKGLTEPKIRNLSKKLEKMFPRVD